MPEWLTVDKDPFTGLKPTPEWVRSYKRELGGAICTGNSEGRSPTLVVMAKGKCAMGITGQSRCPYPKLTESCDRQITFPSLSGQ